MSLLGLVVLVCLAAAGIVVHASPQTSMEALPEPEDSTASRSYELAVWNDPRMWRGCSDYPPPSGVKLRERD